MRLIKRAAPAKKDTKEMQRGSSVNCATSGFMELVLKSNQRLSRSFSLFCSKVFMCFTIYSSMQIGCPYFSSKLFTETNILNFKQFISVSYKMCRMDIAENHALGFAYYTYKTLISFKIYVVVYQY